MHILSRGLRISSVFVLALSCVLSSAQAEVKRHSGGKIGVSPGEDSAASSGEHAFDWQIGTWKVHMSRLQHPLTGSKVWTQLDGTVVVRKVWQGRANLAEIVADGPSGHLEFLSLRLYNSQAHQWSLNFASSNGGRFGVPMIGEFKNGRGEFYDEEEVNGRTILVRFVFTPISANSTRDEQAFSEDGGKTWEVNWINTQTRVSDSLDVQ